MNSLIRQFASADGDRKVEVYRRPDGTFGFEEWRHDHEADAWIPAGRYSHGVFDSEQTAVREARDRVEWLRLRGYQPAPVPGALSATEVESLVRAQISNDWGHTNLHGCDLRACVVQPELMRFFDPIGEDYVEAWLVLREDPRGGPGYGVCYDGPSGNFGLVQFTAESEPHFIGFYGGFFDAFDAM